MKTESQNFINEWNRQGLKYGDFVSHTDIDRMAGLKKPVAHIGMSHQELMDLSKAIDKFHMHRMIVIEEIKGHLLKHQHMLLVNVRSAGYRCVQPNEQTEVVLDKLASSVTGAFKKAYTGLKHTNVSMLNGAEAADHSLAQAKVASLKGLVTKRSLAVTPGAKKQKRLANQAGQGKQTP